LSNPRANLGQIIVAAGGLLVIISLFLPWYGGGGESQHAMETIELFDLIVILLCVLSIGIAVGSLTGATANTPLARMNLLLPLTGAIALIVWVLAIEFAWALDEAISLKFGAYFAMVLGLAMVAGAVLASRPDLAAKVEAATAGIGAGAGPGAPGAGPGAPGAGPGAPGAGTPGAAPAAGPGAPGTGAPSPAGAPGGPQSPGAPPSPAPEGQAPAQPPTATQPALKRRTSGPGQASSSVPQCTSTTTIDALALAARTASSARRSS
jgi:hypothetical protein